VRFVENGGARAERPAQPAPAPPPDRGFGTNDGVNAGRLIVLAIDQANMTRGGGRAAMEAAGRFLDRLTPADRVGLVTIPVGPSVDFTNDYARVKQSLMNIVGGGAHQYYGGRGLSLAEAFAFMTGQQRRLWTEAVQIECSFTRTQQEFENCLRELEGLARDKVMAAKTSASISLQALKNLIRRMGTVEGPKQLILVGQSMVTGTNFGDLDLMTEVNDVGLEAQRARVTVSVIHMDRAFIEAFDVKEKFPTRTLIEDSHLLTDGLVQTAGAAGGAYYSLSVAFDPAFDRIARETSAAYEVGFETIEADRDGKVHKIEVKVGRPGVTVRARRSFVAGPKAAAAAAGATDAGATAPSPRDRVARILESPVPRTALPIRLRAHALAEPGGARVRVLIAADIGREEKAPAEVSLGYFLRAPGGAVAGQAIETADLQPSGHGSLYYSTVLIVPPGEYMLRLAALDAADRAGVVEAPVTARFEPAGGYELSDPLLTEPDVRAGGKMKMNVDGRVSGRELSAYVELRGAAAAAPTGEAATQALSAPADVAPAPAPMVRFDVINPADGTVLVGRLVKATAEDEPGRWFAEATLNIASLPEGRCMLRVAPVDPATGDASKGMTRTVQITR
jgi:VWFA-related protein